jgi:hypothetical protein
MRSAILQIWALIMQVLDYFWRKREVLTKGTLMIFLFSQQFNQGVFYDKSFFFNCNNDEWFILCSVLLENMQYPYQNNGPVTIAVK